MLLTADIGNTNIVLALLDEKDRVVSQCRVPSGETLPPEAYDDAIRRVLEGQAAPEGAVIGSVVPRLTAETADAIRRVTGLEAFVAGPTTPAGLDIAIEQPETLGVDLLAACYSFPPMDPMLASVFGGALIGLSLGMVFLQGATTGGTDLIARLLKLKLAWLPMGRLLLAVDLLVIVAVAVAFRNIYSALYGVVALYISSFVMDQVLYGMDNAKVAYIISDAYDQISHAIIHDMDRGVTLLHGEGGWSGEDKKVLLVAFKQKQIVALKQTVKSIDPNAFLIVCEAHEILGDGFREYKHNDL